MSHMAKSVAITDNASPPAHSEGDNQVEASCRVLVVTVVAVIVVRILSTLAKLISSVRPKHGNRTSCLHTNERELRRKKKTPAIPTQGSGIDSSPFPENAFIPFLLLLPTILTTICYWPSDTKLVALIALMETSIFLSHLSPFRP